MCIFKGIFLLAALLAVIAISSASGQSVVQQQDQYIKNITEVDFSSGILNHSLELYSETKLYRVAGALCRIVTASQRTQRLYQQPELLNLNDEIQDVITVGNKVQQTSCAWFNVMFGGVVADQAGECSVELMNSFCLKITIVNKYLDIYRA